MGFRILSHFFPDYPVLKNWALESIHRCPSSPSQSPPNPQRPLLVAISLMIAFLVAIMVAMVMVTVATVLVLRAAHAQRLLDSHLLPPQLHGIDEVIDDGHGPHGRGVP